jgi:hypothetical protein
MKQNDNQKIAQLLGLPPRTLSATIHIGADSFVKVIVERHVTADDLEPVLEQFALVSNDALTALRRDAERYRKMRDIGAWSVSGDDLDTAVDSMP